MSAAGLLAVVPVRDGVLPLGGDEAVAEAGGRALLVGTGCNDAAHVLRGAGPLHAVELEGYTPGTAAAAVTAALAQLDPQRASPLILPGSPDGRDLAPLVAHALGHPLLAGAVAVHAGGARVARHGGAVMEDVTVEGPFVSTLQPGVRGVEAAAAEAANPPPVALDVTVAVGHAEPRIVAIEPPDPATIDLAEAPRIIGGGAGLGRAEMMDRLGVLAAELGCSVGATRVVTDWGWAPFERQIGTTGVAVAPDLYLAFGISGAVQHTAGLGDPPHVISVNLDVSCPMMHLADLAIVADAPAVVDALLARLNGAPTDG